MFKSIKIQFLQKPVASFLMAIIIASSFPISVFAAPVVDIKANGQDSFTLATSTDSFTLDLITTNATACQMTSPRTSGVSVNFSITIAPGDVDYPAIGGSTTFSVSCLDGAGDSATDSVVVSLPALVLPPALPTVDVLANGSNGPLVLSSTDTYTYSWTSANATACQQSSPSPLSGITLSGSSATIDSTNPFFPTTGSPVTITINCTDGVNSASDSVVIELASVVPPPPTPATTTPSVDVKANGQDGTLSLSSTDTYTYSWTSANATACQQSSPSPLSGITLSGSSATIDSTNPFFPTTGSPVTITINCTDGVNTASDSVVIELSTGGASGGGGGGGGTTTTSGGGGGGGGGHRRNPPVGSLTCPLIEDYMRIDLPNDPIEVMKLQGFLKVYMGYNYVEITGTFDEATYKAVGEFQALYKDDILTPWGHTAPTHYVYILTTKKINEIFCKNILNLTDAQIQEIADFRALMERGGDTSLLPIVGTIGGGGGNNPTTTQGDSNGQNIRELALALLATPEGLKDKLKCIYEVIVIIIVLYILGSFLRDVLYIQTRENALKRFLVKWVTISIGLAIAITISFYLGELCIVLPLALALLLSIIWMALYPKNLVIRSKVKSTFRFDRS